MTIIVGRRHIVGDVAGLVARLEALVTDLERLATGDRPSIAELARAPLLDPVGFGTRELPCLVGGNQGHPFLTGPVIKTSDVWALSLDLGWARTLSRYYRLGRVLAPGERP
ncbi:DUF6634 family protein [Limobrevibacterium gyesilva]|uniref:Uncharacterized protein n=1 Tax=Limobrevibacterium gyesilva TaxID=2991712 RepID=A0AA41YS49_9PROT|nr:DUF6634 family protein [Limobrevibacterium gyesilva]MCW3477547.1 hypothetical protein [Limobrevibacterium gyesilva]